VQNHITITTRRGHSYFTTIW